MNLRAVTSFRDHALRVVLFFALTALLVSCASGGGTSEEGKKSKDDSKNSVPSNVTKTIDRITSKPLFKHSTWGISVRDLSTGKVLLGQSGDKMFVPASTFKTLSGATVLDGYGPDHRFKTPVYRSGTLKKGVAKGDLVLVASGDLSLGLREKPDGTMVYANAPYFDHTYANAAPKAALLGKPLTGLNELAKQVHEAGIRKVEGNIVIDDRLFEPWKSPDGLISPIWVNENRIDITAKPTSPGESAKIKWRPRTAAYTVKSDVETVPKSKDTELQVDDSESGVMRISGQIAAGSDPAVRVGEVKNPAAFARTAFIEALERAGVEVSATPVGANPSDLLPSRGSYRKSDRVAEHVSGPLKEFTSYIFKTSHNPGGQLFACLAAVEAGSRDCQAGLAQEYKVATSLGVPKGTTFIFDGAGSDDHDRTTPDAMTKFLRAVDEQSYGKTFETSLALMGKEGTQAEAEKDSPAVGKIRIKDGTRVDPTPAGTGVLFGKALVGYAETKGGHRLAIAIMVKDVPISSPEEIFPVVLGLADDQDKMAVAIQQGY
jgi:D-alanyl-D-alanine carboxypeptidase/D-alanyl-D-alanine-endopeptidase (penicillin-binding protein 4)